MKRGHGLIYALLIAVAAVAVTLFAGHSVKHAEPQAMPADDATQTPAAPVPDPPKDGKTGDG